MTDLPDLELTLPARAENVGVVRHVLGAVADTLQVGDEQLDDMRLAVSEACANAVVHAYAGDAGLMEVHVHARPHELEIRVRDHGRGMAPRADSPGLGVGLPLMASVTLSMELLAPDGGGTEVRMRFPLRPDQADRSLEPHAGDVPAAPAAQIVPRGDSPQPQALVGRPGPRR